jgi:toxin YoeB
MLPAGPARPQATASRRPARQAFFHSEFREDLEHWVASDRRTALRILRDPFRGLGKPELLRHLGDGVWSRRLTQEHRVVYRVAHDRVDFIQARYHY